MELADIVKLMTDNGLSLICVGYLIYFQNTTMKEMLKSLNTISERLTVIENKLGY